MTNEEIIAYAEHIRPKKCKMVNGRLQGGFPDHDSDTGKAIDAAIEALEKADKYRWHDLRKNPDDLPYMDGDYLCFIDNEPYSYCSVCEWDNPNWYNYNGTESDNVIAWQYIEPLERI